MSELESELKKESSKEAETREKLVLAATLKTFKGWILDFDGTPDKLKDHLLKKLEEIKTEEILDGALLDFFSMKVKPYVKQI